MLKNLLIKIMPWSGVRTKSTETVSRRAFLVGAGAAIGAACLAPGWDMSQAAAAALTTAPSDHPVGQQPELAQYNPRENQQRRDDRRDNRMSRREIERECLRSKRFRHENRRLCESVAGRNDRRDDRRDNRRSRRDVERECLQSNRFRRNNPGLCDRVMGRNFGRQGTCITIGPIQVCE